MACLFGNPSCRRTFGERLSRNASIASRKSPIIGITAWLDTQFAQARPRWCVHPRPPRGQAWGPAPLNPNLRNWDGTPKRPRYYQQIAINRAVQAIARGDERMLLVLATGTGKTLVAAQIVAKLWNTGWPGDRKPRVLYLADRNILIDQPKDEYFEPMFGDAVHKLSGGEAKTGRLIYFALYQSLDSSGDEASLYRQFRPDYFDVSIQGCLPPVGFMLQAGRRRGAAGARVCRLGRH